MPHLTLEDLARLVDESCDESEIAHLRTCPACAADLEKMREQTRALANLPLASPRAAIWAGLEQRLRGEGLLAPSPGLGRSPAFRAAAAVALFLLGSLAGGTAVRVAGGVADTTVAGSPATVAEAAEMLRTAESVYLNAVSQYAALTEASQEVDPVSRLTALEGILLTTGAALRDAPADPVINNYHLTALGLRDALIRRIDEAEGEEWY
ncbi:MAG TPA: hypothetical protein VMN39_05280 [Longimicrobiaceae bacterium]|nr:hypothetical protein [Longimicrobiaceae bacterium]